MREVAEFVELLRRNGVRYVCDVRSMPYSRRRPEFSRQPLERVLRSGDIRYVVRLLNPQQFEHLWVLAGAGLIGYLGNEVAARIRLRAGRRLQSAAPVGSPTR